MNPMTPNIVDHILILLLGIILPTFAVFQSQPELKKMKFDTALKTQMYFSNGLSLWIITLVVSLVWFFSGRPLPTIGFQFPVFESNWVLPLIITLVLLYIGDIWNEIGTKEKRQKAIEKWKENAPFLPANHLEFQHFVILAFSAGFCEEVVFRGYFIQYLLYWTGDGSIGYWLAIIIPGLVFAVSHWYQGWKAVLKIMVLAIAFGVLFIETKSLWIVIILHFLIDLISGYIAMKIFPETTIQNAEY